MRITCLIVVATTGSTVHADRLDEVLAAESCSAAPKAGVVQKSDATTEAQAADDEQPVGRLVAVPAPPAVVAYRPPERPLSGWERELGARRGSMKLDGVDLDFKGGVFIAGGYRFDRLTVFAEYMLAGVGYHSFTSEQIGDVVVAGNSDGILHRLGLTTRVAFARGLSGVTPDDTRSYGELWLEGGVGEDIISWDNGGVMRRPDVVLGIGVTGALHVLHRRGGIDLGFRVAFGRRTDLDGAASLCSAPCTQATPPATWGDRSYLFQVGLAFGR